MGTAAGPSKRLQVSRLDWERSVVAVITNARSHKQQSMLGYGELVLEAARSISGATLELPVASSLSAIVSRFSNRGRLAKLIRNIERFGLTPLLFAGRRADIVHVIDPGNVPYLDVIRHRASVVTVHDLIPYLCQAGRLEGFRPTATGRWLMRRILSRLRRVDRIVCVSEATRRDLLELSDVEPGRVVTIPNAVFQPMGPATPEACRAVRQELGLPPDAPLVLHVGRNFYKNRRIVLEVFARIHAERSEARLLLVGALPPELAKLMADLGLEAKVHVAAYVAPEKMAALYTTASLLLFPSLYEGFGYPVLEAQLCGTPVICSNGGSLPEVAGDGALIFAPDDVDGMTSAALELLETPETAGELVARGRRNAARFTRDRWFAAHAALYAELATSLSRQ